MAPGSPQMSGLAPKLAAAILRPIVGRFEEPDKSRQTCVKIVSRGRRCPALAGIAFKKSRAVKKEKKKKGGDGNDRKSRAETEGESMSGRGVGCGG